MRFHGETTSVRLSVQPARPNLTLPRSSLPHLCRLRLRLRVSDCGDRAGDRDARRLEGLPVVGALLEVCDARPAEIVLPRRVARVPVQLGAQVVRRLHALGRHLCGERREGRAEHKRKRESHHRTCVCVLRVCCV